MKSESTQDRLWIPSHHGSKSNSRKVMANLYVTAKYSSPHTSYHSLLTFLIVQSSFEQDFLCILLYLLIFSQIIFLCFLQPVVPFTVYYCKSSRRGGQGRGNQAGDLGVPALGGGFWEVQQGKELLQRWLHWASWHCIGMLLGVDQGHREDDRCEDSRPGDGTPFGGLGRAILRRQCREGGDARDREADCLCKGQVPATFQMKYEQQQYYYLEAVFIIPSLSALVGMRFYRVPDLIGWRSGLLYFYCLLLIIGTSFGFTWLLIVTFGPSHLPACQKLKIHESRTTKWV